MRNKASTRLDPVTRWLGNWWPSTRLRKDPLGDWRVEDRYVPVSIANWKLTPAMARTVLARRVRRPLKFLLEKRLTVVIPFRDRDHHLQQLLPVLASALLKQGLQYRVLIVEQSGEGLFNRGKLINAGMHYAAGFSDYFCIHDVDALPIFANYRCPTQPLRLVNRIVGPQGEAQRPTHYFSGAISIRKEQAFAANGFSNEYWGWGKEDDDFFFRLLLADYLCYYDSQGVFKDLPNPKHQQIECRGSVPPHVKLNRQRRSRLLRGLMTPGEDGLSTLRYEVISEQHDDSQQRICVRI